MRDFWSLAGLARMLHVQDAELNHNTLFRLAGLPRALLQKANTWTILPGAKASATGNNIRMDQNGQVAGMIGDRIYIQSEDQLYSGRISP
jgi:hypothetical protein